MNTTVTRVTMRRTTEFTRRFTSFAIPVAVFASACTASRPLPAPAPTPVSPPGAILAPLPATTAAWHPAKARLLTRWAANVDPANPLPEYPRPQMTRERWQNLNGLWEFSVVTDSSAPLPFGRSLPDKILVPFAVESALSGVGRHADRIVYRRTFTAPFMSNRDRLLLHFGAVDWQARVYVNGSQV